MTQKPAFAHSAHFDKHDKSHLMLSVVYTKEAISLVTMCSKELLLVQENHATVKLDSSIASRRMKT